MKKAIHFVCRNGDGVKKVQGEQNLWESGCWVISDERTENLIGSMIYLHDSQSKESYHGGDIVEVINMNNRRILRYVASMSAKNVPAPKNGWSQEKCYVGF
jgi:hypothetical protein